MAGQGAGPSRRSHTKSRKGCKTCKRRHIRCDETFPQCGNCTKHQVRCDYMENVASDNESQHSPEQSGLTLTPGTERNIDIWQQTGSFPYPELQVFPPPQTHEYSKNELRLIHHLSSVSNDLLVNGTSNLTVWSQKLPKFLSIASSYPYVMHALLSFSANHLAWITQSTETRNLHIQHGGIALRGLHEAIGNFSHANADAVLAASLLLLWQATDWRSWCSLRGGIQTVISAMQSWKHESLFAEFIEEQDLAASELSAYRRRSSGSYVDREITLQTAAHALQRLLLTLVGQDLETSWTEQLLGYIQRLQASKPAETPEEQFNHLYVLRKWLFWVPISLLQRQGGKGPAMLTLALFYATALNLEPLFPELGSSFCASMALSPLESIIQVTNAMRSERGAGQATLEIASLMQFPQQAATRYRDFTVMARQRMVQQQSQPAGSPFMNFDPETLSYSSIGNLSPAFAPVPLYLAPTQLSSASHSPYLGIPTPQSGGAGFSYGTREWGAMPSPGFPPPQAYQEGDMYGHGMGASRGFVPAATVWT